jgi:hypothetical protein
MRFVVGEMESRLLATDPPERHDNVFHIKAPVYVPLEDLSGNVSAMAIHYGRSVMWLTCYSQPSTRLLKGGNIHDILLSLNCSRRVHFDGCKDPYPELDEECGL